MTLGAAFSAGAAFAMLFVAFIIGALLVIAVVVVPVVVFMVIMLWMRNKFSSTN
jgi:hypothetical protein